MYMRALGRIMHPRSVGWNVRARHLDVKADRQVFRWIAGVIAASLVIKHSVDAVVSGRGGADCAHAGQYAEFAGIHAELQARGKAEAKFASFGVGHLPDANICRRIKPEPGGNLLLGIGTAGIDVISAFDTEA